MREIFGHTAGRLFLLFLLATMIALVSAVLAGALETAEGEAPVLWFGWITPPLALGILFVLAWLAAYWIYFTFFWPYR